MKVVMFGFLIKQGYSKVRYRLWLLKDVKFKYAFYHFRIEQFWVGSYYNNNMVLINQRFKETIWYMSFPFKWSYG